MAKEALNYLVKTIILFLFLTVFMLGVYYVIIKPSIKLANGTRTMSIEGTAQKYVKPDTALVEVGARFSDSNISNLKKQVDKQLGQTKQEIIALGIAEEKIKSNYSIYPEYDYNNMKKLIGYATNATMEVKVKDFSLVDKILEIAIRNNLNVVNSVSFIIEDPDAVRAELKAEAINDAKEKAQKLADETGISIGKIIDVAENGYGSNEYPAYRGEAVNQDSISAKVDTITPGEQEVSYTVTLVYEIND